MPVGMIVQIELAIVHGLRQLRTSRVYRYSVICSVHFLAYIATPSTIFGLRRIYLGRDLAHWVARLQAIASMRVRNSSRALV